METIGTTHMGLLWSFLGREKHILIGREGFRAAPGTQGRLKDATKNYRIVNALLGLSLHTLLGQKCIFTAVQSQTTKSGY